MFDLIKDNRFNNKLMLAMPDHGDGSDDEEEDDKTTDPPSGG